MQTVIWAFGSMVVFMLIFYFLPLGFTMKGKLIIGLAGFVLALGGNAAVVSFPIWLTFIILAVVSFFVAYMMNSRLASTVYQQEERFSYEEDYNTNTELPINKKSEKASDLDLLDLDELDVSGPTYTNLKVEASLPSSEHEVIQAKVNIDAIDEEISFLDDRDSEDAIEIIDEVSEAETSYLSEIESLLLEDSKETINSEEDSWLDELAELSQPELEEDKDKSDYDNLIEDDFELEILAPEKEVAAGRADGQYGTNILRKVALQK